MMLKLYCLYLVTTGEVFYVGVTKINPNRRLRQHLERSRRRSKDGNWQSNSTNSVFLREKCIDECGVLILMDNLSKQDAFNLEIKYIAWCKEIGIKLNNDTLGGEGILLSEQKLKKVAELTKKRMMISGAPRKFVEKAIEYGRSCKGTKIPEERKIRISKSLTGRRFSDEHSKKISSASIGRKVFDNNCKNRHFERTGAINKVDISKAIELRSTENMTMKQIAEYFDVSFDTVRYVFRKKIKK